MKDNNNYGLEKVPDAEIIKQLRIELGKANAYITELEASIVPQEVIQSTRIKKLQNEVIRLQEANINYQSRIIELQKEIRIYEMAKSLTKNK